MNTASSPNDSQQAIERLRGVRIQFGAEPTEIRPFDSGSTLSWTITPPDDSGSVIFRLNGSVITLKGAIGVHPPETAEYCIEGAVAGARMVLARATVTVVTDHCIRIAVPEQTIHRLLQEAIDDVRASTPLLTQRRPASVEVDARGIHVRAFLRIAIENAPDPDLDIDGLLGLGVEDGAICVFFRRFSVDLDSPRWFTIASAGLSKVAEQPMEALITDNLKPMLLRKAEDMMQSHLRMMPPGFRLYRIDSGPDELTVIVCPLEPSP
jgi:hypothetical protein